MRKNRKPIKKKINGSWKLGKQMICYICPECNNEVGYDEGDRLSYQDKYCSECGAKMDWSDINDHIID